MSETKTITDKQKAVRMANMKKARAVRMENLKKKKEEQVEEYDLSSNNDSSSESDADAFIISKKKPMKRTREDAKSVKVNKPRDDNLQKDFNELKNIVYEIATMQKKQNKTRRERPSGGTKIVVLPNNGSGSNQTKSSHDSVIESLKRTLFI